MLWWQAIRPHSWSPSSRLMLMLAATPMFARYSRWMGLTLRSTLYVMSSGASWSGRASIGTGV